MAASVGARFFPNDTRTLIGSKDGHVRIYTIDADELVTIAQGRNTRTLTDSECQTYNFEDCG